MNQITEKMEMQQPTSAGTFSMKIENTTYMVGVHFSQTAKDTLEDKMKRLMLDDIKTANFWGKNSEDIPSEYLDNVLPNGIASRYKSQNESFATKKDSNQKSE